MSKEGSVSQELIELYEEADQNGLAVNEFTAPKGFLAALFSKQEMEDAGITDLNELTGTTAMLEHSWPGFGDTREEAVKKALDTWRDWKTTTTRVIS